MLSPSGNVRRGGSFLHRGEEGLNRREVPLKPHESKIPTGVECPEASDMAFQARVQTKMTQGSGSSTTH